jgi:hypothetical protein
VSSRRTGRPATLPPTGFRPATRLIDQTACRVRFVPENPAEQPRVFDFTNWSVSPALREAFAAAFAERTRIGGRVRTVESAVKTWRTLRRFTDYLVGLASSPATPDQLTAAHLRGWFLPRQQHVGGSIELGELKTTLRQVKGISAEFLAALDERNPSRVGCAPRRSYSRSENQRILNTARRDIRRTAERIRGNRDLLRRWRAGELDLEPVEVGHLGELFDCVDRHADVPRSQNRAGAPMRWVSRLGTVEQHIGALHLSPLDAAAFAVLLVGLTGQNKSSILAAPAAHHRPDGYAAVGMASAIVELDKPRRGSRRHMDVPLTSVPSWAAPPEPDGAPVAQPGRGGPMDLQSPFGVYMLLHELAASARKILGSDRLLVWWSGSGGGGVGRGLRTRLHSGPVLAWSREHDLPTDAAAATPGGTEQLVVTLSRLRLTYNELQQRPVAHTDKTLANEYLVRNRGNLAEYQHVVAGTLAEQVTKATTRASFRTLSEQDLAEAREHPARVAARHGMDPATLQRMLAGELDTMLGACIDHTNSPHAPAGQPCGASFMLCLSCPCARAIPAHLPVQVLVHDELERRKAAVTPLRWAQRFVLPHAQLADLLDRAGPAAVADARQAVTAAERQLVDRFLHRELDLP